MNVVPDDMTPQIFEIMTFLVCLFARTSSGVPGVDPVAMLAFTRNKSNFCRLYHRMS